MDADALARECAAGLARHPVNLSPREKAAFVELFKSYRYNPRGFVFDLFRTNDGRPVELEPYQVEIMEAVAAGRDVTVRSGHGVGKTTTDAFTVYWYLLTHPFSKVPTTAPTFRQVKDILWAEIAKWHQHFRLKDQVRIQTARMGVRGRESEWFAIGVASNKPENIEGFHAPHVLFIVDEAKGVQKAIYDSIDGALTSGGQRLYTSTPGSRAGQFYESHFGRISKFFHQIHINGERSARVSQAWREQKAEEWGLDSPIYQAKVLGEFPTEGDDILIRLDYILAAEAAAEEEKCGKCGRLELCECGVASVPALTHGPHEVLGCDVARYGMDDTAVARGSSRRMGIVRTWSKRDLVYTANELAGLYKQERAGMLTSDRNASGRILILRSNPADSIGVDDTGLGGGVTDQLIKLHNVPCVPVIFGAKTALLTDDKREHFANNKAFLAWKMRQALEENWRAREAGELGTFALEADDRLKGQLSNLRVQQNNKGQLRIIDPDDPTIPAAELPKGVRVSPDRAHAAIICYHTATTSAGLNAGRFTSPTPPPTPKFHPHRRLSRFIFGGRRAGTT